MPGVAGRSGRTPKRVEERMGHRSKAENEAVKKVQVAGSVTQPPADPEWHRIARHWYESLAKSGQAMFFEPSDWGAAQYVAQAMHDSLDTGGGKISASSFSGVWAAMNDLLTTEGSRRRVRLELERTGKDAAKNTKDALVLAEYREKIA